MSHRRSVFRHHSADSSSDSAAVAQPQSPTGQSTPSFYERYFTKSVAVPAPASVTTTHSPAPVVMPYSCHNDEKDEKKSAATPRVSVYAIDFVRRFSFLSVGSLVLSVLFGVILVAVLVVVLAVHFTHHQSAARKESDAAPGVEQVATSVAVVAATVVSESISASSSQLVFSSSTPLKSASVLAVSTLSSQLVSSSAPLKSASIPAVSTSSSQLVSSSTTLKSTPILAATPSTQLTSSTQVPQSSFVTSTTAAVASSSPAPISPNAGIVQNTNPFAYTTTPIRLAVFANFADPTIYHDASSALWYAFATNSGAGITSPGPGLNEIINTANIQIATSPDFTTWTLLPPSSDPLPVLGAWVTPGTMKSPVYDIDFEIPVANVWAPEVIQHPTTSKWLLYYSAASSSAPAHCIGAATAPSIAGPYTPLPAPLTCPASVGGAIDASAFVEPTNNTLHLAYKIDGNAKGHGGECGNTVAPQLATPIMLQTLSADGLTPDPAYPAVQILDRTAADGPLVEAPSLVKVGGVYYLFYSSGCTRNTDYDVKYATSTALYGPYTRAAKPLLVTGSYGLEAPGSVTVRYAGDAAAAAGGSSSSGGSATGWKIALHARVGTAAGGIRPFFTAGLAFDLEGRTVGVVA